MYATLWMMPIFYEMIIHAWHIVRVCLTITPLEPAYPYKKLEDNLVMIVLNGLAQ